MRGTFPVFVLTAALGLALALRGFTPQTHDAGIVILAVSSPTTVRTGESYSTYGGLSLPEGRYEKRFRVCEPEGCKSSGSGAVTGPGEWWGFLGSFTPATPGAYQAELLLFERNGVGAWHVAARHAWSVDAR